MEIFTIRALFHKPPRLESTTKEMALFRSLTARTQQPQLTKLYRARASPRCLTLLGTATLLYGSNVPRRGIILAPRTAAIAHSTFLGYKNPVSRPILSYSSRHWLHTQSGSWLTDKAEKKKPKETRERQKSDEHGSVLNELMSIKAEDQPKELTVGAKGMTYVSPR